MGLRLGGKRRTPTHGMRFAAVADVDGRDLTRFAQLVSAP